MLERIERAGRTCYKSEDKITPTSSLAFIKNIIARGHESVLEHEKITVRVICDRGVSHEIVRHRIASYSQESTRYCNYSNDKFGNEITFIDPSEAFGWTKNGMRDPSSLWCIWEDSMRQAEENYFKLIGYGATPQEARDVLPNSVKTEIVITMNLREWRWFFIKRTANDAHPQMRQIARPMLKTFRELVPVVFDDIGIV
jgi:thymidylate synthase (FAD)